MKYIRRIICALLALIFAFGMMPMDAAVHASGEGVLGETVMKGNRDFKWPVPGYYNISACFFDGRDHYAIDIITNTAEADVVASYDGVVCEIVRNGQGDGGYGNAVMVQHTYTTSAGTQTLYTHYSHLNSFAEGLAVGTPVVGGVTVLGKTGGSGYGSAYTYPVHLDFQIFTSPEWEFKRQYSIDPYANNLLELPEGLKKGGTTACCQQYIDAAKALYAQEEHECEYEAKVTPPTCTEDGYTTYTCECGDTYTDDIITALGHEYEATVITPTCTEDGYTTYSCECGDGYVSDYKAARGYEWMLEDGEFNILLIGNSFSEDASNAGMPNSQMLDILQAMLGDSVSVTVGLCYSGGKGLNWHATQSEQGNSSYSLRVISSENGTWKSYGSYTSSKALTWTNWDVVSLQHYEINTTTGKEGNAYPDQVDPKFDNLESATEFMLDYVDKYAPDAAVYFYMHWARAYKSNLNESLATYNKMADFFPVVMDYAGPDSANRFETIIPVGLSVQNARTTYLATLAYNTTAAADKNLNLQTDAQIGLQRDGGHLTYNVGRYIAALTFAETVIPQQLRAAGYVLPDIRVTESIGRLPKEYTLIAQKSVTAAVDSWSRGSLAVTPVEGYTVDPIKNVADEIEISISCVTDGEAMEKQIADAIRQMLGEDFRTENIVLPENRESGKTVAVSAKVWYGYSCKDVQIAVTIGEHTYEDGVCTGCGAVLGDLNNDGLISAEDLTLLARHVAGIELLTGTALSNGDTNKDGYISSYDLTKHARYVAGIITDWDQE